jgi:hypothetical protein
MRCMQPPSLCFHALRVFQVCKHHFFPPSLWDFVTRVDLLDSIIYLNRTHVFKWYAIGCGSKNKCQKEVGLVSSKLDVHSKFNSKHNWGGGLYDHLNEYENLVLCH